MDYLWAPWRHTYMTRAAQGDPECIFCVAFSGQLDAERLVLHRGKSCAIILNLFPYTAGHLMIAPYRHLALLEEASPEELSELSALCARSQSAIRQVYKPEGYNVGMNLGRCAGAGVVGHFHMHVLPRWTGDSNFMTVIGETRVVSEEPSASYDKLKRFF